ncbi:protein GDAP2 homolog [Biomphalaria glabrata]|uniref:Protein GDAP2 homolog n=1 Tax=Biomphalaria glabrata TaxID=6526 RepID=A0A9W3AQM2_BIOGL|nr:protein GDAP2 homolog [Biomphalaria glabrata]
MEVLGQRHELVEPSQLTRWNFTKLLGQPKEYDPMEERSPFPWRNDLNAKIVLWNGNITTLNVHAITHATNEHMNDRNLMSEELFKQGGPGLVKEVREDLRVCKTGEAKLSKGHNLPARYVIHSVGPRYNLKYVTAAESALFSCYRTILQICKEAEIRTLGLGAIHSARRNYPPDKGAHIAIRTVRRFLEKFPESFDLIIFVCSHQEIFDIYSKILPLYFPRDSSEEEYAFDNLPSDIGNGDGEPVIKERQIRIIDKPTFAALRAGNEDFEQTIDLNKEFAQSMEADVGHHPFATMEENPDKVKASRMLRTNTEEIRKLEAKKRYEILLRRAKTEDLTEIAALHCIFRTGVDRLGRPIVVVVGKNYPAHMADPEKTLLYMIRIMDPVVETDYVIVYFHTLTSGKNQPAMAYLKMVYSLLDYRYRKNLKHFYIVHPTWWSKLAVWFFTTFTASDIKHKVHNLKGVQYLYTKMNPDQIDVPPFVQEYDIKVNGPRYVVQDDHDGL